MRAATWLALALGLAAWPAGPAPPVDCPHPRPAGPGPGWTRTVRCDRTGPGPGLRGPARQLFGLGLDPNAADAATLETLPGIGPARARAIVEARREGPYCRPRDLERVPGIGPITRGRLESRLRLRAPPGCHGSAAGP